MKVTGRDRIFEGGNIFWKFNYQNISWSCTDAVHHGNIKKDTRKIVLFTGSIQRGTWMHKFSQYKDRVVRLKRFPGATLKELAHYAVPTLKAHS